MDRVYRDETVDRAIAKGLEELNVSEADVKIDVEEEGRKGLLGFGKKDAAVRLTIINPELKLYDSIESLAARNMGKTETDVSGTSSENEVQEQASAHHNTMEETEPVPPDTEVQEDALVQEEMPDETRRNEMSIEEAAEETRRYIDRVIRDMNIERSSEVSIRQNEVQIELSSPMAAKLIGKRGATLNALQEVAQQYFNSIYRSYGSILLDVENYREKRRETLESLAVNMAKKAQRTNRPVRLEAMPSSERKIMHHVLSRIEGIETHSEGSEPNRYIVIEKK
ncbi:Jag N-terminal domain-containing protein [Salinicoccus sp. ID82-1]|uniref:RNA-binding cell elongation regulator Jag/EloR n=1 Tax=Salinicoccus sp. ID82-1 TaxID=2820269 RepID=UPI001F39C71B|nr:RNA-binding cell elongation regulator Jag/EloR [Salinicoccus sp. ID82-1]MCG1010596.1 Jag N-terminal domain-containing protein [Salinicoccus sp. ID82-1]